MARLRAPRGQGAGARRGEIDADSPEADGWAAVASILSNAFIEAIEHGIEDRRAWRPEIERGASR